MANLGDTTVRGDIGAPAQPSGFPPGVIVGNMQVGSADAAAYTDMLAAYTEIAGPHGRHPASGADRRDADPRPVHAPRPPSHRRVGRRDPRRRR